jgi:hypothetical protein
MEIFVAGVFLCVGFTKILSYRRRPRALGAREAYHLFALPYWAIAAIGLFEIGSALTLVAHFGLLSSVTPALMAASGLAILTLSAAVYRTSRQETAVPSTALFLLALFMIVGYTL